MTTITLVPDAVERFERFKPLLSRSGEWGDGVTSVGFLQSVVPGVHSIQDCVTDGWPEWLADRCEYLFTEETANTVEESDEDAFAWAEEMARVLTFEVDYGVVATMFLDKMRERDVVDPSGLVQQKISEGLPDHASECALNAASERSPVIGPPYFEHCFDEVRWQRRALLRCIQEFVLTYY